MIKQLPHHQVLLLIPASLFLLCYWVSQSELFAANPFPLSLGLSIDLIATIPLIFYLLLRKTTIPNSFALLVFVLGLFLALHILPKDYQKEFTFFSPWLLSTIEVGIILIVLSKLHGALWRKKKTVEVDFHTAARTACQKIMPPFLARIFSTELSMIYYGFYSWKKKMNSENEFSYHKETGSIAVLGALILIIGIETLAVHLLIEKWSSYIAWIFTGLSVYSGLQIFGILKSLSRRPIKIADGQLRLSWGIFHEANFPLSGIKEIEAFKMEVPKEKDRAFLSPLNSLEGHNVKISLQESSILSSMYGKKKVFREILLYVDQPKLFINQVSTVIQSESR